MVWMLPLTIQASDGKEARELSVHKGHASSQGNLTVFIISVFKMIDGIAVNYMSQKSYSSVILCRGLMSFRECPCSQLELPRIDVFRNLKYFHHVTSCSSLLQCFISLSVHSKVIIKKLKNPKSQAIETMQPNLPRVTLRPSDSYYCRDGDSSLLL